MKKNTFFALIMLLVVMTACQSEPTSSTNSDPALLSSTIDELSMAGIPSMPAEISSEPEISSTPALPPAPSSASQAPIMQSSAPSSSKPAPISSEGAISSTPALPPAPSSTSQALIVQPSVPSSSQPEEVEQEQSSSLAPAQENSADIVFRLVNEERRKVDKPALKRDYTVEKAANIRATEIVDSFSHTRPDGTECFTALDALDINYKSAGENLASGYTTATNVMDGWMNSPSHKANILDENDAGFTHMGIGVYTDSSGQMHWTQFFTS